MDKKICICLKDDVVITLSIDNDKIEFDHEHSNNIVLEKNPTQEVVEDMVVIYFEEKGDE